ncbi:MAG: phasin family protein [Betaproteobacteria bacterium]|nr:phasin family protein [Betaproteobacteria bacterium]
MARRIRTSRPRKSIARPASPAQAIQTLRSTTRKAVEAGVQVAEGVRRSAVGAFDSLVKQGSALQAKSRRAAVMRATQAGEIACARAVEAKTRTVEAVSHLEKVFEQRVSRAISRIGVPTTRDVRALSRQVAQLQASVEQLRRSRARAR